MRGDGKQRKREEEWEIEGHRERVREGEGRRGERRWAWVPPQFFMSVAAIGWLLHQCRGVDGRGVGGKKRKREEEREREREKSREE